MAAGVTSPALQEGVSETSATCYLTTVKICLSEIDPRLFLRFFLNIAQAIVFAQNLHLRRHGRYVYDKQRLLESLPACALSWKHACVMRCS
jgi:hypothetical protein